MDRVRVILWATKAEHAMNEIVSFVDRWYGFDPLIAEMLLRQ